MGRVSDIPLIGGQNTRQGVRYTMGGGQNTIGRGLDIPLVGGLIYHG